MCTFFDVQFLVALYPGRFGGPRRVYLLLCLLGLMILPNIIAFRNFNPGCPEVTIGGLLLELPITRSGIFYVLSRSKSGNFCRVVLGMGGSVNNGVMMIPEIKRYSGQYAFRVGHLNHKHCLENGSSTDLHLKVIGTALSFVFILIINLSPPCSKEVKINDWNLKRKWVRIQTDPKSFVLLFVCFRH